ncbi:MAG: MerR family transcriptional regulator [Candidatus Cryptobacteroides sp.]|nr:MerR family transcriptional regulator [Bacteroidales bacterium]
MKLSIGEFSKLCGVTVKTLRHYEKIGLLRPHSVESWTGYRYYTVSQMQPMLRIRKLKDLGLSLEEIYELSWESKSGDGECTMFFRPDREMIVKKLGDCEKEIEKLVHRKKALRRILDSLNEEESMNKIYTTSLPEITVASYRAEVSGYNELMYLCPNVIGPEMGRLGCTCPEPGYCFSVCHDSERRENGMDLEYMEQIDSVPAGQSLVTDSDPVFGRLIFRKLPAVEKAVCLKFIGPYDRLGEGYAELYKYLEEKGLEVNGQTRCSFVDGIWNEPDPEKWCSIIQAPVK